MSNLNFWKGYTGYTGYIHGWSLKSRFCEWILKGGGAAASVAGPRDTCSDRLCHNILMIL